MANKVHKLPNGCTAERVVSGHAYPRNGNVGRATERVIVRKDHRVAVAPA